MIILLVLAVCLVSYAMYKYSGTLLLPTTLIFFPITAAVVLLSCLGGFLGFYSMSAHGFLIILFGLLALTCGQYAVLRVFTNESHEKTISGWQPLEMDEKVLTGIIITCLVVGVSRLAFLLVDTGVSKYFDTDGLNGALLSGLCSRFILVGYALCPLILRKFFLQKNKFCLMIWLAYVVLMFMTMVKYHSILLILASLSYCCFTGALQLKKTLPILIGVPIGLFYLSYIVIFSARGEIEKVEYLNQHLMNYLGCGVLYSSLASGTMFASGFSPFMILLSQFTPIPNMISRYFTGANLLQMTPMPFVALGTNGERGNVCNLVSMFFLSGDWIGGFFALLIMGAILSLIIVSPKNSLLACFVASCLILAFFGDYFALSPVWEVFLYSTIIPLVINKTICKWEKYGN